MRDLQAIAAAHPMVTRMLTLMRVKAGAARLADLEQHGVNAPVWHSIGDHTKGQCGAWEL
ncbi:hypothetical protein [Kitasatospora sp. NPDC005751]|uniref:hypothetical protein n=1 Tax=Kitasatospora sp. NPDC005751 TaxID=3157064 RepID=UPI0033CD739B